MLFISRDRSPEFVLAQGGRRSIKDQFGGDYVELFQPASVKFERLAQPFKTAVLPRGVAEGMLDSRVAAEKLRRSGWERKDPEGNDVTEQWVIASLMKFREYGRDFVAVSDDGREIEDTVVVPEGDGGYFCTLCEKHLSNIQAKEGHVSSSSEHKQKLAEARQGTAAALR